MKKLLLTLGVLGYLALNQNCYCQEWTPEKISVIDQFGLEQNDGRGIMFVNSGNSDCTQTINTVLEGIESFLSSDLKRDITTFCIENLDSDLVSYDQAIDLNQIVTIYLETKK